MTDPAQMRNHQTFLFCTVGIGPRHSDGMQQQQERRVRRAILRYENSGPGLTQECVVLTFRSGVATTLRLLGKLQGS
jgi:hypothetical protein